MTVTVGEAKGAPLAAFTTRKVRARRKVIGEVRSYRGRILNIFWIKARPEAWNARAQVWIIDAHAINAVRAYGVSHVGILSPDGSKYLVPIGLVGLAGKERGVTYHSFAFGTTTWHVPINLFGRLEPPAAEREANLVGQMHLSKGRR